MKGNIGKMFFKFLCCICAVMIMTGIFRISVKAFEKKQVFSWDGHKTIAHALGAMEDKTYLNSKEGFLDSYEKGTRLFEVDLAQTSDGEWVCRHTWKLPMGQWKGKKKKVLSTEEFLSAPVYGKYTPMTFKDLVLLLKDHPDAYILVDSKKYSSRDYENTVEDYSAYLEIAREADAEDVISQIIPELYNESMYTGCEAVYPFTSYIYSLWQEYTQEEIDAIAEFCKDNNIPAATVNYEYWNEEIQNSFESRGIRVFLYTLNDFEMAEDFLKKGVSGFCTDVMKEKDFTQIK